MPTRIVHLPVAALDALAAGDLATAQQHSPVGLSDWLVAPDNLGTWRRRSEQVRDAPEDLAWVTGVLWAEDAPGGAAVGRAGFHAAPDTDGMVELGYAVDPAHRRRGHARAALEGAIARCRADPAVRTLRLTISPDNAPSLALAAAYPFVVTGEQWDDEDGPETILELDVGSR